MEESTGSRTKRAEKTSLASLRWHDRLRAWRSKQESQARYPTTGHMASMAMKTPLPINPSADDESWPRATPQSLILSPPKPAQIAATPSSNRIKRRTLTTSCHHATPLQKNER
ncbi:hypothetical protein RHMOL_Rhmol04G0200800 [Rhododendron molle]|uniref:Uncharacterized protein n=1 Tax=Rhododendron molle TaxID=49168 RepID=A0ACC0P420_RHOML|nr:hypothetical protein RHMOL_Rhmol04G0200800 [Rhododendron molle]